jgi:hypothetical protein
MNQKEKIEELEKRIRDLEARPVMPTIILMPAAPTSLPFFSYPPQPIYPWPANPWQPTYYPAYEVTCEANATGNYPQIPLQLEVIQ